MATPRRLTDLPLPRYPHVPGRTPHPFNDPDGHSYEQAHAGSEPLDPACWRENAAYLRGVELFNHCYYWEAHEVWEGLWHSAGRRGQIGDFLKGLIQLAVAGVKHLQGIEDGVRTHARRAEELWRSVEGEQMCGLRRMALMEMADAIAEHGWPEPGPVLLLDGEA